MFILFSAVFFFVSKNRQIQHNSTNLRWLAPWQQKTATSIASLLVSWLLGNWSAMIPPKCSAQSSRRSQESLGPMASHRKQWDTRNQEPPMNAISEHWNMIPEKKDDTMTEKSPWTSLTCSGSSGCSIGQVTELVEARGLGAIFWGISKRYSCSSSTCEINWNVI